MLLHRSGMFVLQVRRLFFFFCDSDLSCFTGNGSFPHLSPDLDLCTCSSVLSTAKLTGRRQHVSSLMCSFPLPENPSLTKVSLCCRRGLKAGLRDATLWPARSEIHYSAPNLWAATFPRSPDCQPAIRRKPDCRSHQHRRQRFEECSSPELRLFKLRNQKMPPSLGVIVRLPFENTLFPSIHFLAGLFFVQLISSLCCVHFSGLLLSVSGSDSFELAL